METFSFILSLIDTTAILYALFTYIYGRVSYKRINLSVGSFKIRKKDFNVQAIINIVNRYYYEGGHIPDEIRKEIIKAIELKIKDLVKYDNAE